MCCVMTPKGDKRKVFLGHRQYLCHLHQRSLHHHRLHQHHGSKHKPNRIQGHNDSVFSYKRHANRHIPPKPSYARPKLMPPIRLIIITSYPLNIPSTPLNPASTDRRNCTLQESHDDWERASTPSRQIKAGRSSSVVSK